MIKLQDIRESRQKGVQLSTKTYRKTITIYRAVESGVTKIYDMDYVTLSRKFAVEHAENNAVVYGKDYVVLKATVPTDNLYEATNPGEYFYSGRDIRGGLIYTSKGYGFEGWYELSKSDFVDKRHDDRIV
jgi:hypothetical protein